MDHKVYYTTTFLNGTLHTSFIRHERSVAGECLINECLEKLAYYTFATTK
jgi:hypothetical protein